MCTLIRNSNQRVTYFPCRHRNRSIYATSQIILKFISAVGCGEWVSVRLACLICGFTSQSTTMVMSKRSVNLTTLFPGRLPKRLTSHATQTHIWPSYWAWLSVRLNVCIVTRHVKFLEKKTVTTRAMTTFSEQGACAARAKENRIWEY